MNLFKTKSVITEHSSITDILRYINEEAADTVTIFDIDNTLVKPLSHLGGLHWHDHHTEQKARISGNPETALQETIELWVKMQPHLTLEAVEQTTTKVLSEIQSLSSHTFALTSRSAALAPLTLERLKSCAMSFAHSGLEKNYAIDTTTAPYHYEEGVFFCGSYQKGKALVEVLEELRYRPKKVIFVDDVLRHVENVQKELQNFENTIEFIGIRYSHLDSFAFDPHLAEQEFLKIKKLL